MVWHDAYRFRHAGLEHGGNLLQITPLERRIGQVESLARFGRQGKQFVAGKEREHLHGIRRVRLRTQVPLSVRLLHVDEG